MQRSRRGGWAKFFLPSCPTLRVVSPAETRRQGRASLRRASRAVNRQSTGRALPLCPRRVLSAWRSRADSPGMRCDGHLFRGGRATRCSDSIPARNRACRRQPGKAKAGCCREPRRPRLVRLCSGSGVPKGDKAARNGKSASLMRPKAAISLVPPRGIEPRPDDYKSTARPSCYGGRCFRSIGL